MKNIIIKFSLGDIVNVNPDLEGVSISDVKLNPWKIREIRINKTGISYSLISMVEKDAGTGYYEYALIEGE